MRSRRASRGSVRPLNCGVMRNSRSVASAVILSALSVGCTPEDSVKLEVGQEWTYATRPADPASTLVIGKIETRGSLGEIVHVTVYEVVLERPGLLTGATTIGHIPLTRVAVERSVRELK